MLKVEVLENGEIRLIVVDESFSSHEFEVITLTQEQFVAISNELGYWESGIAHCKKNLAGVSYEFDMRHAIGDYSKCRLALSKEELVSYTHGGIDFTKDSKSSVILIGKEIDEFIASIHNSEARHLKKLQKKVDECIDERNDYNEEE